MRPTCRQWLQRLLDPVMPGMGSHAPRARVGVLVPLLLAIGALTTARLLFAPHSAQRAQAVDALCGTLLCLARNQEDLVTITVGFDSTDYTPAKRQYSYDQLKDKDGQTLDVALEVRATR